MELQGGKRPQDGSYRCGTGGDTHSGKRPKASRVCGKGTDLGEAGATAAGSPGPCPPGLYQGLKYSTGPGVGRQGRGKSPLPVRDAAPLPRLSLLPLTRAPGEGVPVKGSGPASKRAGRGRGRSGATAQAGSLPATQEEGLQGTGTLRNLKPIVERCGPSNHRCFRWGGALCLQQPSSPISSQRWLGLLGAHDRP